MAAAGMRIHNAPSPSVRAGRLTVGCTRGFRVRVHINAAASNAGTRMSTADGWAAVRLTASKTCLGDGAAVWAAGALVGAAAAIATCGAGAAGNADAFVPDSASTEPVAGLAMSAAPTAGAGSVAAVAGSEGLGAAASAAAGGAAAPCTAVLVESTATVKSEVVTAGSGITTIPWLSPLTHSSANGASGSENVPSSLALRLARLVQSADGGSDSSPVPVNGWVNAQATSEAPLGITPSSAGANTTVAASRSAAA